MNTTTLKPLGGGLLTLALAVGAQTALAEEPAEQIISSKCLANSTPKCDTPYKA